MPSGTGNIPGKCKLKTNQSFSKVREAQMLLHTLFVSVLLNFRVELHYYLRAELIMLS